MKELKALLDQMGINLSMSSEVPPFFGPGVMRVWVGLRVMVLNFGCAAAGVRA